jgi:transposase InsO family protein/transposase-like protein
MEPVKSIQNAGRKKQVKSRWSNRYKPDFKVKIIKKYLEESVPASVICKESGISDGTLYNWAKSYRQDGAAGLENHHRGSNKQVIPGPVKQKIVDLKKANPLFGIKRISQLLRRTFFLTASPETVRKTLHSSKLMDPPPQKKRRRNITRPRFFERSTPNQLWQTDIFTFTLGGRYAFLIGYIDDYSRYITSLELFRSQTAENVIEVYRRGKSEYNPPREMLTDNGRQYTSWRGNTRFEAELKKDRVHHIKSQPHHPMTLGKIERFWKTIFLEFLSRAQFDSFEDAQERIRQWVKYYNHKRPHQGIGGLCPADRYFEIQTGLRKTIENGIQENLLEMALRGKPRLPFYMVGRMEGQSVVLRAEKGKLRLTVDDEKEDRLQEVVYNLNEEGHNHEEDRQQGQEREEAAVSELRGDGKMQGGAVGVDGAAQACGSMPGTYHPVDGVFPLAEKGNGRDAAGAGAESEPGQGPCAQSPVTDDAGKAASVVSGNGDSGQTGKQAFQDTGVPPEAGDGQPEGREENVAGMENAYEQWRDRESGHGPSAGFGGLQSPERPDNGRGGCPPAGSVPQDVLRMGRPGASGNDGGHGGQTCGQTVAAAGPGETALAGGGRRSPEEVVYR